MNKKTIMSLATVSILSIVSTTVVVKANLFSDVLGFLGQYIDINGITPQEYQEQFQTQALNSLGAKFAPALEVCYVHSPAPANGSAMEVTFNACDALQNINTPNPCDSLPDLSMLGFSKKNIDFDLSSYCDTLTKKYQKINIEQSTGAVDFNNLLKDADNAEKQVPSTFANANKNSAFGTAVKDNDYQSAKTYETIMLQSGITDPSKIDTSNINVAYKTPQEYEKSIKDRLTMLTVLRSELDLNRLKSHAKAQFIKANNKFPLNQASGSGAVSQSQARETQKESVANILKGEYEKLTDKWIEMKTQQELLLTYEPAVLNPTKEYVNQFRDEDRAKVVYAIEKQKAWKANIMDKYNIEGETMKKKANIVIDRARVSTNEINENYELSKLNELTK